MEDLAIALLVLLQEEEGQSLPRINKRLGIAMSQMNRLLLALGSEGLGWLEQREERGRPCLYLSAEGKKHVSSAG